MLTRADWLNSVNSIIAIVRIPSKILASHDDLMPFTVMRDFPTLPTPEVVAKTDQSVTLRVQKPSQAVGDVPYKLQAVGFLPVACHRTQNLVLIRLVTNCRVIANMATFITRGMTQCSLRVPHFR